MNNSLQIEIGQYSVAGKKKINQDFHGAYIPNEALLSNKGIVVALSDGISSSNVSQIASETAVSSFIADYYCTPEAWSTKTSAQKVLQAINAWLYAQTQNSPDRFNKDKGYICTFSALIFKARSAHIFHSGDTRIYQLSANSHECLTTDHRRYVDDETSYLTRALGINRTCDMDYQCVTVSEADCFLLATDGVYEYISTQEIDACLVDCNDDLNEAAKTIVERALENGSKDNLTAQFVKIHALPEAQINEVKQQVNELSIPPAVQARDELDGYKILRELFIGSRSHVYLAYDSKSQQQVVIKTPSVEQKDNSDYLEQFLIESWIAKRLDSPHIVKAYTSQHAAKFLYTTMEYLQGINLKQWMIDHASPSLDEVRTIITQIAKGLQTLHRQEMVHQDIRPNNIMIDEYGIAKIIDLGSVKVAGLSDITAINHGLVGTMAYTAPEYFLGEQGDTRADIYSLGVITYQMLSGRLPYGNKVYQSSTLKAQRALQYRPIYHENPAVPPWIDNAIAKALSPEPRKRYQEVSEFIYDLNQPSQRYQQKHKPPLIEQDPILFWQLISLILVGVIIAQWLH